MSPKKTKHALMSADRIPHMVGGIDDADNESISEAEDNIEQNLVYIESEIAMLREAIRNRDGDSVRNHFGEIDAYLDGIESDIEDFAEACDD